MTTTKVDYAAKTTRARGPDGRYLPDGEPDGRRRHVRKRYKDELFYLKELIEVLGDKGHKAVAEAILAHATDDNSDKQTIAWQLLCKHVYGKVPLSDLNVRRVIG